MRNPILKNILVSDTGVQFDVVYEQGNTNIYRNVDLQAFAAILVSATIGEIELSSKGAVLLKAIPQINDR